MLMDSTAPRPVRVAGKASRIAELRARNRFGRRAVTGDADVVLSLTSYGKRMSVVAHTVESLAAGHVRPRRMILWVDDPDRVLEEHPMLRRLASRGLEVLATVDFRPHKKYFPLLQAEGPSDTPLVVADDDILYPRSWLSGLLRAHAERPAHFLGYRAHWITGPGEALAPYASWGEAPFGVVSPRVFLTTGAGVVYPRGLQEALLDVGTAFLEASPRADDVWVNTVAVAAGVPKVRVPINHLGTFYTYPRTQGSGLHAGNVASGGNDEQLRASMARLGVGPDRLGEDR